MKRYEPPRPGVGFALAAAAMAAVTMIAFVMLPAELEAFSQARATIMSCASGAVRS